MTALKLDKGGVPPPDPSKGGEYYDRCVVDGCIEVDRSFKSGGKTSKGEEYLDWSMYSADRRAGGCGASWARTTRQGAERDKDKYNPKWLTRSALRGTAYSMPSDAYREGYDRIDWSK